MEAVIKEKLRRIAWASSGSVNLLGVLTLMIMMLLTVTDVVMRYGFHSPIPGAAELTELMLVMIVFFALARTQAEKGHISVDLVLSKLSRRIKAIIGIITTTFSLALFSLIIWQNLVEASTKWANSETTHLLLIPIAPFLCAVAFGAVMLCIVLLVDLISHLTEVVKR